MNFRSKDGFSLLLLTACSLFRLQLTFKGNNFFKKEGQRLLSGYSFDFKAIPFLLFKFGYCSAIIYVVVVLVTIVTPHIGPLRITLMQTGFLLSTGSEALLAPLVRLIFSKFSDSSGVLA
jgi:hypothetical protein